MKKILIPVLAALVFGACSKSANDKTASSAPRQLFIADGEFQATQTADAQAERRASPPMVESDYIYRLPQKDAYYFDQRDMPTDEPPAQPEDPAVYKAGYLWKRPSRVMVSAPAKAAAKVTAPAAAAPAPAPAPADQTQAAPDQTAQTDQSSSSDQSSDGSFQYDDTAAPAPDGGGI